jgi:small membrane protein
MVWFQIIALPGILLLLFYNLWGGRRGHRWLPSRLAAAGIWGLAGLAVAKPEWTTRVATAIGIGRGADLMLYLLSLAFLAACFYFYHRIVQLEASISTLVRHIALQDGLQRWAEYERKTRQER